MNPAKTGANRHSARPAAYAARRNLSQRGC